MDFAAMTVSDIQLFLEQRQELRPEEIASLAADKRVSVVRLLNRWQHTQQQKEAERHRLEKLFTYEYALARQGYKYIAGVDEAGRGPLAGPVVVGAVILPIGCYLPGLNDSKQLSRQQRERLDLAIREAAIAYNVAVVDAAVIDRLNIYQATVAGMYQAIKGLKVAPDAVLIDAVPLKQLTIKSQVLIGGDALSASIAAASILAKVTRDRLMEEMDRKYPQYGFARNVGYGTAEHLAALQRYGPCPIHRRSFAPVKETEEARAGGTKREN